MYQSRFEMRIRRHVESGTLSLLDSRLMQKTKRQIIGNLNGQVSMHVASLYKSDSYVTGIFCKAYVHEILCQAQALPTCHANISVPLVM